MLSPLRSRPGLRTCGRVAVTVTVLAAVSAAVIAAGGGRSDAGPAADQVLRAEARTAPAPTGAAPTGAALTGSVPTGSAGSIEQVDLSGAQLAHAAGAAGAVASSSAAASAAASASSAAASSAASAASASAAAAASAAARQRQVEQAVVAARQQVNAAARNAQLDPRSVAALMLADRGWGGQFGCLDALWAKESGWNYRAENPTSGAYGIPQALPGARMASAGPDWQTNPVTQIAWGLSYIQSTYGSPCAAWAHSQADGWY